MELNKLYQSVLRFAGMESDTEGLVYLTTGEDRKPALMNGVRLVLPTETILKSPPSKDRVVFHPLSENTLLGESEIISHLLQVMNVRLNMVFGIVATNLLNLASSPELHKHLDPDQAELLIQLKDIDDTAVTNFSQMMMNAVKVDNTDIYSNIYLRRGGVIKGKKFARAGFVKFKMYEELLKDPTEMYGVKLRVKDRAIFKALHEFIYPNIAEKQGYDFGSSSNLAPFLDALMGTSLGLAAPLNDLMVQYRDFIDQCDGLMFDSDWVQAFENLDELRNEVRRIPPQTGNEGRTAPAQAAVNLPSTNQAERDRAALTIPGAVQHPQVPTQAPTTAWPTVQPADRPAMVQTAAPVPAAAPLPPVQQYLQPGYPQHPVQAPPQIRTTSKGLDYSSLMEVNPMLRAPTPGAMPGMYPTQQTPPPMQMPSWAGTMPQVAPQMGMYPGQQQQPMGGHWPTVQSPMQQQMPYQQQQQAYGMPMMPGVARI